MQKIKYFRVFKNDEIMYKCMHISKCVYVLILINFRKFTIFLFLPKI